MSEFGNSSEDNIIECSDDEFYGFTKNQVIKKNKKLLNFKICLNEHISND